MTFLSLYAYTSYTLLIWTVLYTVTALGRSFKYRHLYWLIFLVACAISALPAGGGLLFYELLQGLFFVPSALTVAIILTVFASNYPHHPTPNQQKTIAPFYEQHTAWWVILAVNFVVFSSSLGWLPLGFYHYNGYGIAMLISYGLVIGLFGVLALIHRHWVQVAWIVTVIFLLTPLGGNILLYVADVWLFLYGLGYLIYLFIKKLPINKKTNHSRG